MQPGHDGNSDINFFLHLLRRDDTEESTPDEAYEMAVYNVLRSLRLCNDDRITDRKMDNIDFCNVPLNGIHWSVPGEESSSLEGAVVHSSNYISGHCERINQGAMSHDGKYALTCSSDGMVILWNVRSGLSVMSYRHKGVVRDAFISSDNRFFVTISDDGTLVIHSISSPGSCKVIDGFRKSSRFSANDRYILVLIENKGVLYSTDGKFVDNYIHNSPVKAGAISSDSSMCITCDVNGNNIIHSITREKPDIVCSEYDQGKFAKRAVFLRNDTTCAIFFSDNYCGMFMSANGKLKSRLPLKYNGSEISTGGKVRILHLKDGSKKTVYLMEQGEKKSLELDTGDHIVGNIAISGNGEICVIGSGDGSAIIWEHGKNRSFEVREQEAGITKAAISYNGEYCLIPSKDCTAVVCNTRTGELIKLDRNRHAVCYAVLSADNRYCAAVSCFNSLMIWDNETGKVVFRMKSNDPVINAIGLSGDGKHIITIYDNKINVTNVSGGESEYQCDMSAFSELLMANSDERFFISFRNNSPLNLCQIIDGQLQQQEIDFGNRVTGISVSLDDEYLVAIPMHSLPAVYSLKSREMLSLDEPDEKYHDYKERFRVTAVSPVSPDGRRFCAAAASLFNRKSLVVVWDIHSGNIVHQFEACDEIEAMRFSSEGEKLRFIAGKTINELSLDASGESVTMKKKLPDSGKVYFSTDGETAVCIYDTTRIKLINGDKGEKVYTFVPDCFAEEADICDIRGNSDIIDVLMQNGAKDFWM